MLVNLVSALEQTCSSGKVAQEWKLSFFFWETCESWHILLDPSGNHDQAIAARAACTASAEHSSDPVLLEYFTGLFVKDTRGSKMHFQHLNDL